MSAVCTGAKGTNGGHASITCPGDGENYSAVWCFPTMCEHVKAATGTQCCDECINEVVEEIVEEVVEEA